MTGLDAPGLLDILGEAGLEEGEAGVFKTKGLSVFNISYGFKPFASKTSMPF